MREIDELLKSDEKFLESLDQVSLQELVPEELGITSMLSPKSNTDEFIENDLSGTGNASEAKDSAEDIQEDESNEKPV